MPKKIDELFSPERLRKSWQKTKEQAGGLVTGERVGKSPLEIFEHLRNLVRAKFSGDDAAALNLLLDDVHTMLIRMFPKAGESLNQAESQADMIPAVYDILNRIEDLVEAFEIAGHNRQRL
jgi:hypothetical protein